MADRLSAVIDVLLDDPRGEREGAVTVHGDDCLTRWGAWCDCHPRVYLVPPADVADLWLWLRRLDAAARHSYSAKV